MDSFVFSGVLTGPQVVFMDNHPDILFFSTYYEDGTRKLYLESVYGDRIFDEGDLVEIPEKKEATKCGKSQLSLLLS